MSDGPDFSSLPQAVTQRSRLPLVWLVPVAALSIAGWIAFHAVLSHGPTITIGFKDADGITAGKTKIRYKSVDVGDVQTVTIDSDHKNIQVTASIASFAKPFLVSDTQFWVERPRLGTGGVTGLDTLVSGAYIGMDVGQSHSSKRHFTGLETPPVVTNDAPGKQFILETSDLGSLNIGAPVYFHHIQVGEITAIALNQDGKGVTLKVFVHKPYDRFVTRDARFWHASGIDMKVTSGGLQLLTESVLTILEGGIAFESLPGSTDTTPADADTHFSLSSNRDLAMKPEDHVVQHFILYFDQSLRGLSSGAEVDFQGITIGQVTSVHAEYDSAHEQFRFPVTIDVFPERLQGYNSHESPQTARDHIDRMIQKGYRAQLRSANLLTGQLYVAIDLFPNAPPSRLQRDQDPMPFPTVRGNLDELQKRLQSVAIKLDNMPWEKIGQDVDHTLTTLNNTLQSINSSAAGPDAPIASDLHSTLSSIGHAADSMRVLTDYLDQHPESILRGKTKESQQ